MKIGKLTFLALSLMLVISCKDDPIETKVALFEEVPNINGADCSQIGKISQEESVSILAYVNKIRTLHKLPLVTYGTKVTAAQSAAMLTAKEEKINRNPDGSVQCYSASAKEGCINSALNYMELGTSAWPSSSKHINTWIRTDSVNERRRILDPFLKEITFGLVNGTKNVSFKKISSAAMYMVAPDRILDTYEGNDFIACPYLDYSKDLFDLGARLSFSAFIDANSISQNSNVDYTDAEIIVLNGQQEMVVSEIEYNNDKHGIANCITWRVNALAYNTRYDVKIIGVKVKETEVPPYEYYFMIENKPFK